jgi:hypothetical protein
LRAVHQLLHGHVFEALRFNALFVVSLLVAANWAFWKLFRRENIFSRKPTLWLWILFMVVTVFTILRNLPAFAWFAP